MSLDHHLDIATVATPAPVADVLCEAARASGMLPANATAESLTQMVPRSRRGASDR